MPGIDLLIALDGMGWFMEELKKTMPPGAVAQFYEEGDGYRALKIPPPSREFASFEPIVYVADGEERLYIATRKSYLDSCLAADGAILSNSDFEKATAGFPEEGNGLTYMSPDINGAIHDLLDAIPSSGGGEDELVKFAYKYFFPKLDYGVAHVSVNHSDGVAWISNTTGSHMSTVYSTFTTPMIAIATKKSMPITLFMINAVA